MFFINTLTTIIILLLYISWRYSWGGGFREFKPIIYYLPCGKYINVYCILTLNMLMTFFSFLLFVEFLVRFYNYILNRSQKKLVNKQNKLFKTFFTLQSPHPHHLPPRKNYIYGIYTYKIITYL